MTLTPDQKRAIDSVLCIFETGRLPSPSAYSTCTILDDGAGISYGKHQSTDKGGTLDLIVQRYYVKGGALSAKFKDYIPYLQANESAKYGSKSPRPKWLSDLMSLLKQAGADPAMQKVQDEIFDEQYFLPALGHAKAAGVQYALSLLVIYDTCIQSGPGMVSNMRNRFSAACPANGGDEKAWTQAYISARRAWLLAFPNPLVQRSVYRMDALEQIVKDGNWDLKLPLTVRGIKIT